jgi:4-amino-4-deoxy-L-arabinose transferase-like glycosyltransferase
MALAGVVLAAAVLRFWELGAQSFWIDEALSADHTRRGLVDVIPAVASGGAESNPPVYYLLLWFWRQAFGSSEAALRSLSALAGALTVPAAAYLAYRLRGARAALVAAVLVATSPILIWYSQEARSYALLVLLVVLSAITVVEALEGRRAALWLWAAAAAALALTHYYGLFVVVAEAVILFARRVRPPGLALGLVGAATLGSAALAASQLGTADWLAGAPLGDRLQSVAALLLTSTPPTSTPAGSALPAAVFLAGAVAIALRWSDLDRRSLWILGICAGLVVVPVGLAVAGIDSVTPRNLLGVYAVALIAYGVLLSGVGRWSSAAVLAAIVAVNAVSVAAIYTQDAQPRDDWRSATRAVPRTCGEQLIVVSSGNGPAVRYYLPDARRPGTLGPVPADDVSLVRVAPSDQPPIPPRVPGFRLEKVIRGEGFAIFDLRATGGEEEFDPAPIEAWIEGAGGDPPDLLLRVNAAPCVAPGPG